MPSPEIMEFESLGEPGIEFQVSHARGVEELSRPFHFTITLGYPASQSPDPKKIVQNEANFKMKIRSRSSSGTSIRKTHTLHGVVTSFERIRQENEWIICRITFESILSRLNLSRKTRTFPNQTAKDVILAVLKEEFEAGDIDESQLQGDYPQQESFSQEEETNFNFVHRLLERYGITTFHKMENNDIRKLALLDNWEAFRNISDEIFHYNEAIPALDSSENGWREGVWNLTAKQKTIPSQVFVTDYNWRKTEYLNGRYPENAEGKRIIHLPGEHFKSNEEGNHIAQLRYERFQTEETLFHGESNLRDLRPGTVRTITNWFHNEDQIRIIRVEHEFEQGTFFHGMNNGESFYKNTFVANPASAPFRPEQIAKKPVALPTYGFVDLGEQYSGLDGDGRYTIREPNHLTQEELEKGKASRSFRRMHPNAGPNGSGNNHPLHNEAEVLLLPVGGDPDRKIIGGSLYNSKFPDIVNNNNSTQSIMRTAGGNQIVQEDTDDSQYMSLYSPKYKSHVTMGEFHKVNPDMGAGVTVGTMESVSITAGKAVNIAAGMGMFADGASQAASMAAKAQKIAAIAGGVCAAASGFAAASYAAGALKISPALMADAAGLAAGIAGSVGHTNAYISSPTKVAVMGGADVLLSAGASIDMCALGVTNVLSGLETLVGSAVSVSVVAGAKDAELLSIMGNVKIEAQKVGNVEIEAKKKVEVVAKTDDIRMKTEAQDILLVAEKRDIKVTAKKNIELVAEEEDIKITATQGKKGIDIQAKAKDVTIDAEKENVNISGMKTVVAKAGGPKGPWELKLDNDKSWHVHLGKAGGPGHFLITDDQMKVWWDGENYVELNDDHLYLRNKFAGVELKSNGEVKLDCAGGKQIKFNGTKMTVDK